MLYPPTDDPRWHWDLEDHNSIMTITVCYCWHALLIVMGLLLQLWFVKHIYARASDRFRARLDELIFIDRLNAASSSGHSSRTTAACLDDDTHRLKLVSADSSAASMFALNSDDEDTVHLVGSENRD